MDTEVIQKRFVRVEKNQLIPGRPRCCLASAGMHLTSLRRNCGHIDSHGYHKAHARVNIFRSLHMDTKFIQK
jgi:hypothetical protein